MYKNINFEIIFIEEIELKKLVYHILYEIFCI